MKNRIIKILSVTVFACAFACSCKIAQNKQEITYFNPHSDIRYVRSEIDLGGIELKKPEGIASDENALYICDSGNDRIVVWSIKDKSTSVIGEIGNGEGEFISPKCIDVNSENICVYDAENYRIQIIKKDGTFKSALNLLDFFPRYINVVDVAIDEGDTIYFSVMLWHKDVKKAGLYSFKEGKLELIEPLAVTAICSKPNLGTLYTISKRELIDEYTWKTGYAEFNCYKDNENIVKNAFSDFFAATDIAYYNGYYYTFDTCTHGLYEFDVNGNCNRRLYKEELPNDFSYNGFCAGNNSEFYLTEINGDKVYELTPIESEDSE